MVTTTTMYMGKNSIYSVVLDEKPVSFGGRPFMLWWTPHARRRASIRGAFGVEFADVFLRLTLARAEEKIGEELSALTGYCSVYDKIADIFAVLFLAPEEGRMFVVSYGDADKMYPRTNEITLQTNQNGKIRLIKWSARKEAPIKTKLRCRLNGKNLRVRLTKRSTKIMANEQNRAACIKKIRKTTSALSKFFQGRELPQGKSVNVWDWRVGTFLSFCISNDDTFDIILFKNVDFVARNPYMRVDITKEGCKLSQPNGLD